MKTTSITGLFLALLKPVLDAVADERAVWDRVAACTKAEKVAAEQRAAADVAAAVRVGETAVGAGATGPVAAGATAPVMAESAPVVETVEEQPVAVAREVKPKTPRRKTAVTFLVTVAPKKAAPRTRAKPAATGAVARLETERKPRTPRAARSV